MIVWHPSSPGSKVEVWRPWWRRKRAPFATLGEMSRHYRRRIDATERR